MAFEYVPTGWSLPVALVWVTLWAAWTPKLPIPFISTLLFVMLGVVPALLIVLGAWKASRKKGAPFLSFGSGVDKEYEAHLDTLFETKPQRTTPATPPRERSPEEEAIFREIYRAPDRVQSPTWTPELLRELEWRRFELLIEGLFRHQNDWRAEGGAAGADGGIDLLLYAQGESKPTAAVQCKAYRNKQVGVSIVRELYGVMAAEGIPHGMVFTCGEFSADAEKFAENKSVDLVNGAHLLSLIHELPEDARNRLLREITAGDYTTPTCPKCRVKMVVRKGPRGDFWGCAHYPKCRQTLHGAA